MQNLGGPNSKGFQLDFAKYRDTSVPNSTESRHGGLQEVLMSELKGQIRDEDCDLMGIPRGSFWGEAPIEPWYPFHNGPPGQMGEPVNSEYMEYLTLPDGSKLPQGAVWANPVRRVNSNVKLFEDWKKSAHAVSGGSK